MSGWFRMLPDYARCPSGATSIEYAMIGLVMSITCIVGATSIGQHLSNDFLNKLAAQM